MHLGCSLVCPAQNIPTCSSHTTCLGYSIAPQSSCPMIAQKLCIFTSSLTKPWLVTELWSQTVSGHRESTNPPSWHQINMTIFASTEFKAMFGTVPHVTPRQHRTIHEVFQCRTKASKLFETPEVTSQVVTAGITGSVRTAMK